MATRKKSTMSPAHKAALAEGRAESRDVSKYLEALEANKPRRGRKRSKDTVKKRLAQIETELATSSPLKRVNLIQEQMNLTEELNAKEVTVDLSKLEAGFIKVAKDYSDRKKISYAAWRKLGVPAAVLAKAGIKRSS